MTEVPERLSKQAQWQKRRRALSWPEKVRLAEAVRDSVEALRRAPAEPSTPSPARTGPLPADRPGK